MSLEPREGPVLGAVDLGASSGRVVAGRVGEHGLELDVVHRFPNRAATSDGHLRWDFSGLCEQVLIGLTRLAARYPGVISLGIDTWAVDYGLLDATGTMITEPVAYRDDRTAAVIDRVHERIDPARLYAITGLQFLPFNTIYQLAAESPLPRATQALLLPDLLAYRLTGRRRTEITNASTTGLLDARTRTWSAEVAEAVGVPPHLFPPLVEPGEVIGTLTAAVAARTGLDPAVAVIAVGSHDTASAVVGVPAADRRVAYVSSGTWSLVGVELDRPVLTEASRAANFTNEGGVDGRVRYLRNEGGLWLLQESLRWWQTEGELLLAAAAARPVDGPTIDVGDPRFLPPGDLPVRIATAGGPDADDRVAVVRCILDSLAAAYARTVADAERLSGVDAAVIHLVGGGSANALLGQLTADLSGRPVLAGPVEATAVGNLAVQARTAGWLPEDLDELRRTLRGGLDLASYEPAAAGRPVEVG